MNEARASNITKQPVETFEPPNYVMVALSAAWDSFSINYLFIMKKYDRIFVRLLEMQGSKGHFCPIAGSLQRTPT